jgi:hypothetical protein
MLEIARRQKAILYLILINLVLILGWIGMVAASPEMRAAVAIVTLWIVSLAAKIISAVLIYRLAKALRRIAWAYAVAALVPWLDLICLLVINWMATRALRQAGLHVGLMGARRIELQRLRPDSPAEVPRQTQ